MTVILPSFIISVRMFSGGREFKARAKSSIFIRRSLQTAQAATAFSTLPGPGSGRLIFSESMVNKLCEGWQEMFLACMSQWSDFPKVMKLRFFCFAVSRRISQSAFIMRVPSVVRPSAMEIFSFAMAFKSAKPSRWAGWTFVTSAISGEAILER